MTYGLKRHVQWAWTASKSFRFQILLYILAEILSVALALLFVYESKKAIDIVTGASMGSLEASLIAIIACTVFGIGLSLLSSWINNDMDIKMTIRLQNSLIALQMASGWKVARNWHTGDLMVRIDDDCKQVVEMLSTTFPSACVTLFKLIASLGFLWVMDPVLAVMVLAVSPLFLFSKIFYKKIRTLNQSVKQGESKMGATLQENLNSRLMIRALGISKEREDILLERQEVIFRLKKKQLKFSTFTQGVMMYTFNGGYLLAFLWGIYRLHKGEITFGTMAAFLQLVGRIQMPVQSLVSFIPSFIRSRNSIDRLLEITEGIREKKGEDLRLPLPIALKIDRISFAYEKDEVLKNFSCTLLPGQPTAIVGPTGIGKTTLIRLMLGILVPDEGKMRWETENESCEISENTLVNFSYVPQGNTLFSGTIRENLLYAQPAAKDEDLKDAIEKSCADFVFSLPQGIGTRIGESGYGLSEGQAQRIAVARALLRNAGIWLFDEATSALDTLTSQKMIANLLKAGKEKILIFATHDPLVRAACTQVVHIPTNNE